MTKNDIQNELEKQISRLITLNYPQGLGMNETEFLKHAHALRTTLDHHTFSDINIREGILPFVLVVKSGNMSGESMMRLVEKDGIHGVTVLRPLTSADFNVLTEVTIPPSPLYILADIDRGKNSLNVPPKDALNTMRENGRSPLTIDEGIAIMTHYPEFLMKNNCFSLLASRTGTDKRVPAIWINAKKEPNLGWCWDGNPHTWLGSASCLRRIAYTP